MTDVALKIENATKRFPGVLALDHAALELRPGEVHALLGENGAGKSTLIKIITGVHEPTEGTVWVDGEEVTFKSPHDAMDAGIGAVHQERNLIPRFTVAENIMLEAVPTKRGQVDYAEMRRQAEYWLSELDLDIDPDLPVQRLSVAQMQLLEIARALSLKSRVLLLDEPTASITEHEVQVLFSFLRKLKAQGVAILFVSHKLEEVFEICDRVTVLRDGKNACTNVPISDLNRDGVVAHMVGRDNALSDLGHRAPVDAPTKLELKDVSTRIGHSNVNLHAKKGEVLGFYGLVGAGRSELARALIGADKITGGQVLIDGKEAKISSVQDALRKYQMGYVSEDRKGDGLILAHSVADNIGVTIWHKIAKFGGFVTDTMQRKSVRGFVDRLEVKTPSLQQTLGNLSGGNQQKVSVAKWLAAETEILIIDEPTVGVDIRTKGYLHKLIWEVAEAGVTVLVISSDMPEIVAVADRLIVMNEMQVVGDLPNSRDYDEMSQKIMQSIVGASDLKESA
ncbi:sugar ABC transporter ATP-binding protein [Cognatishimia activa]|uniref:Ribose import ATP-binding protein RbsA n=1 Tax=Cognatishimia activa TaxID=1715691 RepID=A0A0P1IQ29_9RHOB|nr:sugar ABC transporter ATP-binding protein [Cognatishimia activa]CUI88895.1 Ribose import ATP-binding protein RbsA [Cognatishimia activa]CUK25654.1 Ribose import ATP-binding protein RbsA [Cognatishimia activa]